MSELESAQQIAKDAVELVDMFPLYGDKVNFLLDQLKKIANQPQLTIPAWVAKYQKALEWDGDRHFADDINPYREKGDENRFWNWRRIGDNNLIYRIYKACREMEADIQLVKVVE